MLNNLSMNDENMKRVLMVVVVALVLYLLVNYIKEHKHKKSDILEDVANSVVSNSSCGYRNYEGFEDSEQNVNQEQ